METSSRSAQDPQKYYMSPTSDQFRHHLAFKDGKHLDQYFCSFPTLDFDYKAVI